MSTVMSKYDRLSPEELDSMLREISEAKERAHAERRERLKTDIMERITSAGYRFEDIWPRAQAARARTSVKRGPILYRNPENPSQTWSGRGRRPHWFKAEDKT